MKTPISPVSILGGSSESCRAATQFLNRFVLLAMLLLLAGFCLPAQTPPGEWVWMGGSSAPNQPAVYGTLGTPAPDNTPGARAGALSWTDGNGNLWLFGGVGSELWEFNPSTNEWAWMGGSSFTSQMPVYGTMGTPAPGNTPGAASGGYSTWRDGSGHFWLFGGGYYDPGVNENIAVNALWEFDPSSNEWAWMGGSSTIGSCLPPDPWNITCGHAGVYGALGTPAAGNIPGSRSGASTWTDSKGNFWLFGGGGFDSTGNGGELNDLWVFNPSTNQWTWRGGSSTVNQVGVYGTLGTPAPDNIPGPRSSAVTWEDGSGHFWLYAGVGLADSRGFPTVFDDLWEFNPSLNEWAWMGGSNTNPSCSSYCPLYGEYGTLGSPAAGNIPGERSSAASWTDSNGNLWLLGGSAASEKATSIDLNDIWEFNPSLNEWAWMDGSHPYTGGDPNACKNHYPRAIVCAGSYGTFGIPSAGNLAPGRDSASIWTDSDGHLWLFGGNGCIWPGSDYDPTCGQFNDLWEYLPDGAPTPATPTFSLSSGTYTSPQTVSISDSTPGAVIYYTLDDSTPKASSARYSAPLTISNAGTVIKAYAGELGYHNTEVTNIKYWIRPAAPTFSLPSGQYLTPQPLTISNTFAGATIYYTTDGSRPSASSTPYTGPITIDKNMTIWATVALAGYSDSPLTSAAYAIKTAAPTFSLAGGEYLTPQLLTISAPGATIYYTTDGSSPSASSTLYTGAIAINKNVKIRATAVIPGNANSQYAGAAYAIKAPAPTFSLPSGIYPGPQQVTISDSMTGAAIYYTTDGTTPTAGSTPYTGSSITVSGKEKIIAIATATGYANSPLVAAAYGIK